MHTLHKSHIELCSLLVMLAEACLQLAHLGSAYPALQTQVLVKASPSQP